MEGTHCPGVSTGVEIQMTWASLSTDIFLPYLDLQCDFRYVAGSRKASVLVSHAFPPHWHERSRTCPSVTPGSSAPVLTCQIEKHAFAYLVEACTCSSASDVEVEAKHDISRTVLNIGDVSRYPKKIILMSGPYPVLKSCRSGRGPIDECCGQKHRKVQVVRTRPRTRTGPATNLEWLSRPPTRIESSGSNQSPSCVNSQLELHKP